MKGCRHPAAVMAGSAPPAPSPPPLAVLSGQELETWLEDLESVLYPPASAGRRSPDRSKLSQLWLEDIESVLCPPSGGSSADGGGQAVEPPVFTQLELGPPGHRDEARDCGPPGEGAEASARLRSVRIGEGPGWAEPGPGRGPRGEGRPPARDPPPPRRSPEEGRPGAGRGVRRLRPCPCGQGGGGEQVERLLAENGLLRRRVQDLTAEVEEARSRLIEKVVGAS